jgi:hypothetical protein
MDETELLSTAARLAELNMAFQQVQAKYKILYAAVGPFEIKQLQVWEKNITDMLEETNIQHLSGLAHLLAQLIRARQFIDKYEADLRNIKGVIAKDGAVPFK